MEMIIGGAYQGQIEYAKEKYPHVDWVDGANCNEEQLKQAQGIYNFHEFIKGYVKNHGDTKTLAEDIIQWNPNVILIGNEVGYGIVPMDPFERQYREAVGRVSTRLAAFSHTVTRVICGIPTEIKHA